MILTGNPFSRPEFQNQVSPYKCNFYTTFSKPKQLQKRVEAQQKKLAGVHVTVCGSRLHTAKEIPK